MVGKVASAHIHNVTSEIDLTAIKALDNFSWEEMRKVFSRPGFARLDASAARRWSSIERYAFFIFSGRVCHASVFVPLPGTAPPYAIFRAAPLG